MNQFNKHCSCGGRFRAVTSREGLQRITGWWKLAHGGPGHQEITAEEWERLRARNALKTPVEGANTVTGYSLQLDGNNERQTRLVAN